MNKLSRPGPTELAGLLFVAIIWGSAFPAIELSVQEYGAIWTATLRVSIAFAVLLPFALFTLKKMQLKLVPWWIIFAVALLNMVVPFLLISWSMKHIPAGVGSLLLGTSPFMAMLVGHFVTEDDRISLPKIVSVLLGISGIVVLVGPEAAQGLGSTAIWAQSAIVASGFCYISAGFLMRRVDMPPLAFTAIAMGFGAATLLAIALVTTELPVFRFGQDNWKPLVSVLWLGAFPTAFAYVMRYQLVRKVGVSTFSLAMNTVPVFGVMLAAILLGEAIEWQTFIALMLILTGLMVARSATQNG